LINLELLTKPKKIAAIQGFNSFGPSFQEKEVFGDDASSPSADSVAEVNVPAESDSNIDNVRSFQLFKLILYYDKVGFPCVLCSSCHVLEIVQSLPYYLLDLAMNV
jgi:hypothetical protein